MAALEARLEALKALSAAQLQNEWERAYGIAAPRLSDTLLRHGIAYRLQEKVHGGLSRSARGSLRSGRTKAGTATLRPGTRLVRSWHGRDIAVMVEEDGFRFDGKSYTSLSAVARAVTGTAWSGPLFFGLEGAGQNG